MIGMKLSRKEIVMILKRVILTFIIMTTIIVIPYTCLETITCHQ